MLTRRPRLGWLVAVALLGQAVVLVPGPATASPEQQLADAKQRIEQLTAELGDARSETSAAAGRSAVVASRVAGLEEALNEVAAAVETQRDLVDQRAGELAAAAAEADAVHEAMATRARSLYMRQLDPSFEVLFTGGVPRETLQRMSLLRLLADRDGATFEELAVTQQALAVATERYQGQLGELEVMLADQQALLDEALAALAELQAVEVAARAHEQALNQRKEELEADARKLRDLIQSRARPAPSGTPSKAGFGWPLCGLVTSEYGYRWGRLHAGLDIDGDTGDAVVAAKEGVVIFASWQGGYGRLTLVDHGDGVVTAYAHLSSQSVSEGATVARGDRIGAVGTSGNVTGSHLHFETRVHGNASNPRLFLPGSC